MKVPESIALLADRRYPRPVDFWWSVHRMQYTLMALTNLRENGAHDVRKVWTTNFRIKAYCVNKYLSEHSLSLVDIEKCERDSDAWVDYLPSDPKE